MINSDKYSGNVKRISKLNSNADKDNMPCHTHLTNLDLVWGYNKYICGIPRITETKAQCGAHC